MTIPEHITKPREWTGVCAIWHDIDMFGHKTTTFKAGEFIHVVEYVALEQANAKIENLRDVLADVIRNSHDIIAKKRCSEALAKVDTEKT